MFVFFSKFKNINMKKQFTFALLILLCAISTINAQVKSHFGDDLKERHIKHNAQNVSERGPLFLLKQTTSTYFNEEGKSDGKDRGLYTYNSKGLVTEELSEKYDSLAKIWNKGYRVLTTYDTKNNRTKVVFEGYNKSSQAWFKYSTTKYVYDNLNKLVRDTIFNHDTNEPDKFYSKTYNKYTYDSKNNLILLDETYDGTLPSTVSYANYTYTYGANGKVATILYKSDGTTPSNAKNADLEVFTYLANNNLDKDETFIYENNVLSTMPSRRFKYTYNAKNQVSIESFVSGDPFVERSKYLYSYDSNDNIKNQKGYYYDDAAKKLYYSDNTDYLYSQFVDTKDIQTITFSVSPNPASDLLIVKTNEPILSSTIYDMNGRVMSVTQGDFTSLDIAYLSEGVYFLQVKTQTGMGTTKFIKK